MDKRTDVDDGAAPAADAAKDAPASERRMLTGAALMLVSFAAFWRFMVTANGLFAVVAGVGWAALLWIDVVPSIRRDWKRRH